MQVMKSKKVFLVLNDGRRYEVNPGMAASFSQYAGAIHVDKQEPGQSHTSTAGAGSTSSKQRGGGDPKNVTVQGALNMLGGVTSKWVVTPSHMIGQQKKISTARQADQSHLKMKEETVEVQHEHLMDLT